MIQYPLTDPPSPTWDMAGAAPAISRRHSPDGANAAARACSFGRMSYAPDRRLRAELKLAAHSYHKALAKYRAEPSARRLRKLELRRAELTALLNRSSAELSRAA